MESAEGAMGSASEASIGGERRRRETPPADAPRTDRGGDTRTRTTQRRHGRPRKRRARGRQGRAGRATARPRRIAAPKAGARRAQGRYAPRNSACPPLPRAGRRATKVKSPPHPAEFTNLNRGLTICPRGGYGDFFGKFTAVLHTPPREIHKCKRPRFTNVNSCNFKM